MKLSEAMKFGISLRPAAGANGERFCIVEGRGLCSDPWGAACEAVQPAVATFNWGTKDCFKLQRALDALNAVQHHYFEEYFSMPVVCPGAKQSVVHQGGRITNNRGDGQLKIYEEGARVIQLGGITTECKLVNQMAGMVDHLFYKHNWTREMVTGAVEWYENCRSLGHFEHVQSNSLAANVKRDLFEPLAAFPKLAKKVS